MRSASHEGSRSTELMICYYFRIKVDLLTEGQVYDASSVGNAFWTLSQFVRGGFNIDEFRSA
jgi:hypothetical protein